MSAKSLQSRLEKKRAGRVRTSDTSMTKNILYGHPDGKESLREWTEMDLDRSYDLPHRWARAILSWREPARSTTTGNGMGVGFGLNDLSAVRWYAKKIANIRDSKNPESLSSGSDR